MLTSSRSTCQLLPAGFWRRRPHDFERPRVLTSKKRKTAITTVSKRERSAAVKSRVTSIGKEQPRDTPSTPSAASFAATPSLRSELRVDTVFLLATYLSSLHTFFFAAYAFFAAYGIHLCRPQCSWDCIGYGRPQCSQNRNAYGRPQCAWNRIAYSRP